jgi:hypothetical protein
MRKPLITAPRPRPAKRQTLSLILRLSLHDPGAGSFMATDTTLAEKALPGERLILVWKPRREPILHPSPYFASAMVSIWTLFLAASAVAVTVTWSP